MKRFGMYAGLARRRFGLVHIPPCESDPLGQHWMVGAIFCHLSLTVWWLP